MRILFVCTGNICRSPMAAAFMTGLAVARVRGLAVDSAGLLTAGRPSTAEAVAVMGRRGYDLSAHRSRALAAALADRPDLIVTMARQHALEVIQIDRALFPRTFTLKDLDRRARALGPRRREEPLGDYLDRLAEGRRLSELVGMSVTDDIEDPIGLGYREYERCAAEIEALVTSVVEHLWPAESSPG